MTDKNELPDGGLSKSTAKRVEVLASASVSERARDERFTAMLIGIIADVQDALGFTDEDKECSNGSLEIVAAIRELQEQALTQQRGEPNGKLVGWWNGIMPDVTERSPYEPSVRWGADAEDSAHDIPLYDGYNPIHYTTPQPSADAVRELEAELRQAMELLAYATYHDGRYKQRESEKFQRPAHSLLVKLAYRFNVNPYDSVTGADPT